jgi:hypothetical protein
MALSHSDITAVLKELWPDPKVRELLYEKNPLLGMIAKDRNAHGKLIHQPLKYGDPTTISADFAQRAAGISHSSYAGFDLQTVNEYGFASITGEAIDRSKNDKGSFVRALDKEVSGVIRQMKNRMSLNLFRDGSGVIGRRSGALSGTTFTLHDPRDSRYYEVGMKLQFASAATGGTLRNSGATATVTAVSRSAGTVTLDSVAGVGAFVADDYIVPAGDYDGKLKGLSAWVPASDPGATAFFGVDRSVDPTRLGGIRDDLSGVSIEEALLEASERMVREGAAPDVCVMHSTDVMKFQKAMAGKVIYGARDSYDTKVGYRTIQIEGPAGTIDLVSDPNAIPGVMFMLQLDTWTLYSMGETPKYLDNDGNTVLRTTTTDAVEIQFVSRLQLGCAAPGWNGRFQIGA